MKGYVIQLEEAIVSIVPDNDFDWNFVKKNGDKVLVEKEKLQDEDEIDFRIRMNEVAEKIRRQKKNTSN